MWASLISDMREPGVTFGVEEQALGTSSTWTKHCPSRWLNGSKRVNGDVKDFVIVD